MENKEIRKVRLKNPLSLKERLQAVGLFGHNTDAIISRIKRNLQDAEYAGALLRLVRNTQITVSSMTQKDYIILLGGFSIDKFKETDLDAFIQDFKQIYRGNLRTHVADHRTFLSLKHIFYPVFANLIDNAIIAQKSCPDSKVIFRTEYHEGFPENATFIPRGAKQYKNFMAFHVQDEGKGFPTDVPLVERFTICPEKGRKRKFGLYFTGLVARLIRAPINITSQPGNTIVSVYHPIYVEL